MGLKKYEIITVGSDKRVRALRSWQVQDRYVNIGDVGGIVYDEKTLSQDGACWLFRGNFNFPGARIGGDSIVDVGEAAPGADGSANVDILGASTLVGTSIRFDAIKGGANGKVLAAADFEQGGFGYSNLLGTNWENWKVSSPNYVRTAKPIFAGGAPMTLKLDVPGYKLNWFTLDRDGNVIKTGSDITSGEGITTVVPACHSFVFRLAKAPSAAIVPADAIAARISFAFVYEAKLVMTDSRLEINPGNGTGTAIFRPGGTFPAAIGGKYPDSNIFNSRVSVTMPTSSNASFTFMAGFNNVNAKIDATQGSVYIGGEYRNINNAVFIADSVGTISNEQARTCIQAYDCDNMVFSAANLPGITAMQTAGVPIKFYSCNLIEGRFYHHAQIANTYRDINFDLATKDLGKTFSTDRTLASSEVNGMYRVIFSGAPGSLVESYESVKDVVLDQNMKMYNTTIYADAYLNGKFDIQGTNVFGNSMKHDASNTQEISALSVQGTFNGTTVGDVITGTVPNNLRVSCRIPIRINGSQGFIVNLPEGIGCVRYFTDANGKITSTGGGFFTGTIVPLAGQLKDVYVYLLFKKMDDTPITPEDVKGATVTTYNGCKIVNTKETAATIAGNVRVEDNATLIDTSVTGTGYFGGNSIAQGLTVEGTVYMKDNAVFAPTVSGAPKANVLYMTDNATYTGVFTGSAIRLIMSDNAQYTSAVGLNTTGFVTMRDNAYISGSGSVAVLGALVLRDDAAITAGSASASGDITLCGKYKQTASKTWTGKRVIDSQDAPAYDDNVKTKYDI